MNTTMMRDKTQLKLGVINADGRAVASALEAAAEQEYVAVELSLVASHVGPMPVNE